jgi:hypothetical protein
LFGVRPEESNQEIDSPLREFIRKPTADLSPGERLHGIGPQLGDTALDFFLPLCFSSCINCFIQAIKELTRQSGAGLYGQSHRSLEKFGNSFNHVVILLLAGIVI